VAWYVGMSVKVFGRQISGSAFVEQHEEDERTSGGNPCLVVERASHLDS